MPLGRAARWAAVWLLVAPCAASAASGDPTPGSLAPLVVLVNPARGPAGARIRVQARAQHPEGVAAIRAVVLTVSGATNRSVPLARSERYAHGPGVATFEAVVDLASGASVLRATATDAAGRATSSQAVEVVRADAATGVVGDGNLLVRDHSSQLCADCHALADHGSETAGRGYGAWTTTCLDCHTPHGTRNTYLVKESITPPDVAGTLPPRPVRLARRTGFAEDGGASSPARASFANADGSGPCQVCHTRTARWTAGGPADARHRGDCAFCHQHAKGFRSRCEDCHGAPPASGGHRAHYPDTRYPLRSFYADPRVLPDTGAPSTLVGCGGCHPTDFAKHGDGAEQVELFQGTVLPGGTSTLGATTAGAGAATTCTVACHAPFVATPSLRSRDVPWSAPGPLPCTACHAEVNRLGAPPTARAGPSLHDPVFGDPRRPDGAVTTCASCHDAAAHDASHLTGRPALVDAAALDAACVGCHTPPSGPAAGPQGQVLRRGAGAAYVEKTPPVLLGWTDATGGDFHGARKGGCGWGPCPAGTTPTGFGGTLKAPHVRGGDPLPCSACHAGHASGNAFLFAAAVNGTPVPAGRIDRAGVGGELLCAACHEGERHAGCRNCHAGDPEPPGSACFVCHGHEGVRFFASPYFPGDHDEPAAGRDCSHCHGSGWQPTVEYRPPAVGERVVSGISATGATISWRTDELAAASYVEYGVGSAGWVRPGAAGVYQQSVRLSGLAPDTTYVWRVRVNDASRNTTETPLLTFRTTTATAMPRPDLSTVYAGTVSPQTQATARLAWYPVTAPSGTAVQYEVQLASDPGFTTPSDAVLARNDPTLATGNSGWIAGVPFTASGDWWHPPPHAALGFDVLLVNLPQDDCGEVQPVNVYWFRVRARDALGAVSEWSAPGSFGAGAADPWGC